MQRPWRQEATVIGNQGGALGQGWKAGPAPLLAPPTPGPQLPLPTWQFICLMAGEESGEPRAEPTFEDARPAENEGGPAAALLLPLTLLGPGLRLRLRLREFTGR